MPLYEEKLISPLAVRFTQDHIRTTFRCRRELDDSIAQIEARRAPSGSDYDLLLRAPFPHVEIIRWRSGRDGGAEPDAFHWFTLDNRRLYCLQRAAMAHWPLRVAAVVEILYAEMGRMKRKYDSTEYGWSVNLAHSLRYEAISRWDWRGQVSTDEPMTVPEMVSRVKAGTEERKALESVAADDAKASVDELTNAPAEQGMLAAFLAEEAGEVPPIPPLPQCPPPSVPATGAGAVAPAQAPASVAVSPSSRPPSPPGGSSCSTADSATEVAPAQVTKVAAPEPAQSSVSELRGHLDGSTWNGNRGEQYTIQWKGGGIWTVLRSGREGGGGGYSKKFTMALEESAGLLWWGTNGAYYLEVCAICRRPDRLAWISGEEAAPSSRRPRFTWHRSATKHEGEDAGMRAAGRAGGRGGGRGGGYGHARRY